MSGSTCPEEVLNNSIERLGMKNILVTKKFNKIEKKIK